MTKEVKSWGIGRKDYSLPVADKEVPTMIKAKTSTDESERSLSLMCTDKPSSFAYRRDPLPIKGSAWLVDSTTGIAYTTAPAGYFLILKSFGYTTDIPFRILGYIDNYLFADIICNSHELKSDSLNIALTSELLDSTGATSHTGKIQLTNLSKTLPLVGTFKVNGVFKKVP